MIFLNISLLVPIMTHEALDDTTELSNTTIKNDKRRTQDSIIIQDLAKGIAIIKIF